MTGSNDIKSVVARVLRGLPADINDAQVKKPEGEDVCVGCYAAPVAERGSQAHAEGLCVECASFRRRNRRWSTPPFPGI